MKRLVLTLCVVILAASAWAEGQVYTLEQCIQMAKDKDPDLIRFRNLVKTANSAVWSQAGNFLPSLGVSGNYGKTDQSRTSTQIREIGGGIIDTVEAQGPISFTSYSAGYGLDWTLFDGLRNVWGYLGSRASKRVAEYNLADEVSKLVYIVKGEYYFALKSKRDVEVARDAVGRSEELLKLFEEKYELGSASLSEVLKQRVQYGRDQLTLVSADRVYKVALAELALTVGLDPARDFDIADLDWSLEEIQAIDEYIREATQNHPLYMAAQSEVSASRYDVRNAWGWYLPRLSLQYSKGWQHEKFEKLRKFGPDDNARRLSLSVSWTIFDGFIREENLTRAKVTLNNARANLFYMRNLIVKNIRDAYLGVKLAEETMRVTGEIEKSASEDMQLVQEKYNLGAAALWELLDAQVSLKEAQFNKVKAAFDYNLAKAQLQNAIGE